MPTKTAKSPPKQRDAESEAKPSPAAPKAPAEPAPVLEVKKLAPKSMALGNYIGALAEALLQMGYAPAVFEAELLDGPPHNPTFRCYCTAAEKKAAANASTKKDARRLAAGCWINLFGGGC